VRVISDDKVAFGQVSRNFPAASMVESVCAFVSSCNSITSAIERATAYVGSTQSSTPGEQPPRPAGSRGRMVSKASENVPPQAVTQFRDDLEGAVRRCASPRSRTAAFQPRHKAFYVGSYADRLQREAKERLEAAIFR
jgi:hypothetical protein